MWLMLLLVSLSVLLCHDRSRLVDNVMVVVVLAHAVVLAFAIVVGVFFLLQGSVVLVDVVAVVAVEACVVCRTALYLAHAALESCAHPSNAQTPNHRKPENQNLENHKN